VQTHFIAAKNFCPALDSFTIEQERDGAPYIASQHPTLRDACDNGRVPLALSISHSNGYAFCVLSDDFSGATRLGADIELVEPRPATFAQEFFTTGEQSHVNVAPPAYRDLLMAATWSAKEAVLKATHLGLRADPRGVECIIHPERPRHWTPIRVQLQPSLRAQSGMDGPLRVWWRVIENRLLPRRSFVLTLAAFGTTL
jgi:phosphopantetheinyl transferase (holo-ACP synthase)